MTDIDDPRVEEMKETVDDLWPEGMVVAPCPRCGEQVVMTPAIGGFGDRRHSYKRGKAECECGLKVTPTLTVSAREPRTRD